LVAAAWLLAALVLAPAAHAQGPDTAAPALPDTAAIPYQAPDVDVDTLFDRSAYGALADSTQVPAALPAPSALEGTTREQDTLALAAAVRLAVRRNPDARIARGRAAIAEENHALGNAGLLPYADLTLRRSRQPGRGAGGRGGGTGEGTGGGLGESGSQASNSLTLRANYTLFEGFRRVYSYRRLGAREDEQALRARYQTAASASVLVSAAGPRVLAELLP
jgi:outer membrane protein TolC